MAENKFSKSEAIRFGWRTMKSNIGFFVGLSIIAWLIFSIPDLISVFLGARSRIFAFAVSLTGNILGIIVSLGLIKISLNFSDNRKSRLLDLFSQYKLFFKFLFASILDGLIVGIGILLLVAPGIYLAVRLQFYAYFIVDKNSGITESLKQSWRLTQGSAWNLLLFGLLLALINIAGALALLLGLFATVPTTMVAMALVYRKLLDDSGELTTISA